MNSAFYGAPKGTWMDFLAQESLSITDKYLIL